MVVCHGLHDLCRCDHLLRRLYWDVLLPLLRLWAPEAAAWLADHVGRYAKIIFGRHRLPWYKVWMHPT